MFLPRWVARRTSHGCNSPRITCRKRWLRTRRCSPTPRHHGEQRQRIPSRSGNFDRLGRFRCMRSEARFSICMDNMDSAAMEMNAALSGMREHDDKEKTFPLSLEGDVPTIARHDLRACEQDGSCARGVRTRARRRICRTMRRTRIWRSSQLAQARYRRRRSTEMDLAVQLNPNDAGRALRYADDLVPARNATAMLRRSCERRSRSIRTTARRTCCSPASRTSSSTPTTRSANTTAYVRSGIRRRKSNCSSRKHG